MSQPVEQLNALEGERGLPSVNEAKRSNRGRNLLIVFLSFFVIGMIVLVYMLTGARMAGTPTKKTVEDASSVPERTFDLAAKPALPGTAPAEAVPVITGSGTTATPVDPATTGEQAKPKPVLDRAGGSLMVYGAEDAAAAPAAGAQGAQGGVGLAQPQAANTGPLSGLLTGTSTPGAKAQVLANRDFLLAKGAFIDCALQTRLDSTVPGMTACVVTRNVYSDNGRFVLIERGSSIIGEYQSNMKQGMARMYVLWTRVKTPNGVVVNLDSPGADPLGGAGLPGYIDNHFWKRFGGAMLLSLVDDAARYATEQQRGGSGGSVTFDSTSQASTDMASIALQNTINIPPTLYKNQGERVGVYVARDLDFSGVYRADLR